MADRITSPFQRYSTAREVVAGHDLSGMTVIVTGAATGIGVETVRALAEQGADVVIADIGKTAKGKVSFEMLDLSDFASIRAFGARWGTRPLNVLINNAAVMACPLDHTKDGLEMQIGTNHFGHFLLSVLLAPALIAG